MKPSDLPLPTVGPVVDLSRESGVALWKQIQQVLEAEIAQGVWPPGEKLPTEFQLAERFDVNRHTVRRALAGMEEKGLLRVEQGRGIFVHEHVIDYMVTKRTRFTENLRRQNRSTDGKFLFVEMEGAPEKVAKALGLREGDPVICCAKVSYADGRPINVSETYFSAVRFPGIEDVLRECESITEALQRCGVRDYTRKTTRVIARLPSQADADHLRQPRNRPVLVTEGLDVDEQGRPVSFGASRWASDWVQIVFEN